MMRGEGGEHFESATSDRIEAWVAVHSDAGVAPYEVIFTHEVLESLTDPRLVSDPAYRITQFGEPIELTPAGSLLNGGELADLCERFPSVPLGPFSVTRSWSNDASAMQG